MSKLVSGYLWAWKNTEAGLKSVNSLKKFYSDADIFINVDYEGDVETYKKICDENGFTFSRNNFQLGYCGDFGDVKTGRECWPIESCVEWMDKLIEACKKTDSIYIMLFEEDDFVLKPISILDYKFSIAIHPTNPSPIGWYRPNHIPSEFLSFIKKYNGDSDSPGYAAGGGTIFNREEMIDAWEFAKPILVENFDYLRSINKIIGWQDYLMQFIMQLKGYKVIQNDNLGELWEVKDNWPQSEIITGFKDHTLITL